MSKVIFTADDFGVNEGIDEGVIKAVQKGYINSVAAFSNHKDAPKRIKRLMALTEPQAPEVGSHLTLTSGKPLTGGVDWLTKGNGYFHSFTNHRHPKNNLSKAQRQAVKVELEAQIDALAGSGVEVKHLSSHHNVLYWFRDYAEILFEIALERDIPVRSPLLKPRSAHTQFMSTIRMLLIPNLRLKQMGKIRRFSRNLDGFLESLSKLPAMPHHTDARAYGPPYTFRKDLADISSLASQKRILVREELSRLAKESKTVEFVFHLLDDHYPNLEEHKTKMKKKHSDYTGISSLYFEGRMAEHIVFRRLRLPKGVALTSWETIKNQKP